MFPIFLMTLFEVVTLIGCGLVVVRLIDRDAGSSTLEAIGLSGTGLVGALGTTAFALIWHFAFALDQYCAVAIILLGVGGFVMFGKPALMLLSRHPLRAFDLAIMVMMAFWASVVANDTYLVHYDAGLYYVPTILQNADDPLTIGIGNVHFRLGYNSSLYLLSGAFFEPYFGIGGSLVVNVVLTTLVFAALFQLVSWRSATRQETIAIILTSLFLFHILSPFYPPQLASGNPTTDWVAMLVCFIATLLSLQIIIRSDVARQERYLAPRLWLLIWLASFALTIKLTQLFTPALALIAVFIVMRRVPDRRISHPIMRSVAIGAGGGVIFLGLWMFRGVLLSGCLVYPIAASCLGFLPWTIAPGTAETDVAWISSFGKVPKGVAPDAVPSFLEWLPSWFDNFLEAPYIWEIKDLLIALLAIVILRLLLHRYVRFAIETLSPVGRLASLAVLAVLAANLALWFIVAPLSRYGEASICSFAACLAALLFIVPRTELLQSFPMLSRLPIPPGLWPAACVFGLLSLVVRNSIHPHPSLTPVHWPKVPEVASDRYVTERGLTFFAPVDHQMQCWGAPRPCTYVVEPTVTSRPFLWTTMIYRAPASP